MAVDILVDLEADQNKAREDKIRRIRELKAKKALELKRKEAAERE